MVLVIGGLKHTHVLHCLLICCVEVKSLHFVSGILVFFVIHFVNFAKVLI
jgi:hypothetical protein